MRQKPFDIVRKSFLWLGVFIIIILTGIIQSKSTSITADIMLKGIDMYEIKGITKAISIFFTFISVFINWIIISVILSYFLSLIQEDYEKLEKKHCFLISGYSMLITFIFACAILFKLHSVHTQTDFLEILDKAKLLQKIGSLIYYLFIVVCTAKIEKMNIKKTALLFIPFAVLFLITNVIFPFFRNPGNNV